MNKLKETSIIDLVLDEIPSLQGEKKDQLRLLLQTAMDKNQKLTKEQQYEKVKNLLEEYTNGLTNKFMEFLQKKLNNNDFTSCAKAFDEEFRNNKEDELLMRAVVSANRIRLQDAKKNEQQFEEIIRKKRTIHELVQSSKHIKI